MTDQPRGTTPRDGGPLAGVRVLELAGMGPAPFCAMLLADLGADVVRLDRPGPGPGAEIESRDLLNRGKRSVVADLKTSAGRETALALAGRAHILLEGFRPGVVERLGVGPRECHARNPDLVYGRMTGWGQEGPLAPTAGHDITYIAPTGALHAIGRRGEAPGVPLNLVGDFGGGGMYLAVGVLAALLEVRRGGTGQVVDAAIVDGASHLCTIFFGMMAASQWRDERGVNLLDSGVPYYDVHETADGHHMAVGALEPRFYEEFTRLLGVGDRLPDRGDPDAADTLRRVISEAFRTRSRAEWIEIFDGSDACVAPVRSLREASEDPHLVARRTFLTVNGVTQPAPAPRFDGTPTAVPGPPPVRGEHTEEVLSSWDITPVHPGASADAGGRTPSPGAPGTVHPS